MLQGANRCGAVFGVMNIVFLITFLLLPFSFIQTVRAEGVVYISQVQITGGLGKTNEDFVELYNPGDTAFNLNGYRLVKRTAEGTVDVTLKSWTDDAFIPAKGFFLWANASLSALTPDAVTSGSLANDNGVALRLGGEDVGSIIDSVAWGSANNGFVSVSSVNMGAGESLLRSNIVSPSSGFIVGTSNPRTSLSISVTPPPPEQPLSPPPPQSSDQLSPPPPVAPALEIVITEVLPNPAGDDSGNERIELKNNSSTEAQLVGWRIGDSGTPITSANIFTFSIVIPAQGYAVIILPQGAFALNNSGGETVALYRPDASVAGSVNYTGNAGENESYQLFGGEWYWGAPTIGLENIAPPQPSSSNSQTSTPPPARTQALVTVAEFLPNPEGADEGGEWIELYNSGSNSVNIAGMFLEDDGEDAKVGSGAWVLPSLDVASASYAQIIIPESASITLNNSGKHTLRLFSSTKELLHKIAYADAPEGKSYSQKVLGGQAWEWMLPTPGKKNEPVLPDLKVIISEILPNPSDSQDEFIEIANQGSESISLKDWKLVIGSSKKTLDTMSLAAFSTVVLYQDVLPGYLRNGGAEVMLADPFGRKIHSVSYPVAPKGQSFAVNPGGDFSWTASPTPGGENTFILGDTDNADDDKDTEETIGATKKTSKETSSSLSKSSLNALSDLEEQVAKLEQAVANLTIELQIARLGLQAAQADNGVVEEDAPSTATSPKSSKYLILSGGAILLLTGIAWKALVKTPSL